jgi:hypothetical protein
MGLKLVGGADIPNEPEVPNNSGVSGNEKNEEVFQEMESKLIGTMMVQVKLGKEGKSQAQVERELANRQKL